MNNTEIHQALVVLYQIARKAPVDGDAGDVRENCAKLLQDALNEKFPLKTVETVKTVEKKKPKKK